MEVTAELISIGDELLIGQVVNTNAAWMGIELNKAGIRVRQVTTVSDEPTHITSALDEALKHSAIILLTGGLGPTKDDLTKHTLSSYFNSKLVFNERAYADVERVFKMRGRDVTEVNRRQAELPEACTPVYNKAGTAPGMWFEKEGKVIVSMPGVPHEMKGMMTDFVIPGLLKKFKTPTIYHKTVLTQGIGESMLAELISDWEDKLPGNLKLAYLPSAGMVKLRLSAYESDGSGLVEKEIEKILPFIQEYVYGYDDDTIEKIAGRMLADKKQTLSVAESCTGGYLSHLITSVPGSSAYFQGSLIPYACEIKTALLDVSADTLSKHGAVSEETVLEMAVNCRRKFKTDYALSTSGIAGPGGATAEKQVGLVWIGVATPERAFARKFLLGDNRLRTIQVASDTALNMLRKELIKDHG